jgi:hypothetical protein
MFTVIGGDGREYGPIEAEQIRAWIAEGRINADTKVRPSGSDDWKRVAEVTEFADALQAIARPAVVAPPRPGLAHEALVADVLRAGPRVDIGSCLSRGFDLVKNNLGTTVGATLLIILIIGAIGLLPILSVIAVLVLNGPLVGGLFGMYLKCIRKQPVTVGDAFAGFGPRFVPLMLASIVMSLLIGLGMLFCFVPGIYLAVAWMFTLPLVIDRPLDFWPAMEVSRKVVNKVWWPLFGLVILTQLLFLAGFLACLVGVVFTAPIGIAATMYAYEDIFGEKRGEVPSAMTPAVTDSESSASGA